MKFNTLYNWPKMSQEEFDHKCSIIRLIVENYIRLNDWFSQFIELINQENQNPSSEVYLEGQLNGLLPIFILGGIENEAHRTILEDITYEMVITTFNMNMTVEERANYVINAWKERLLDI